ncbi:MULTISPECIES: DUF2793 domain-containing protein [unclassified Sphingopyxis]|uniref:DUF2793 domain-containing protein n=1 Tax=unclassified Sphingopyxis TaxID=2614943 RepID=UPI0028622850|nr:MULTISPECIES: DUF2793 domain-containing protein [unclassified Sphingopyxis]MDR7062007.1 hypothetical protein [Sphingopyxis sp. BE235]MDR7182465.1 hypothetical protein [Sphingopyxis sp. BE249]
MRTLPNLGLTAFFALGEDGWDDEMSLNMLRLSVLAQGRALDKVAAEPGGAGNGDVYILNETHATHANQIAIRDDGAWVYVTPLSGWLLYNEAGEYYEKFSGASWNELVTGGSGGGNSVVQTEVADYTVAPGDDNHFVRLTAAAAKTISIDLNATTALPANGEWHFRNVGAGDATFDPDVGVTVNVPAGGTLVVPQGGTVTLKRAAADVFDLIGQTVPA